jgi:hypothetical protein
MLQHCGGYSRLRSVNKQHPFPALRDRPGCHTPPVHSGTLERVMMTDCMTELQLKRQIEMTEETEERWKV